MLQRTSHNKKLQEQKKKRVSRISIKTVLSHRAESSPRWTLLCFGNFRVLKTIVPKRGISRFPTENFSSHSAKKFVGDSHVLLC